MFKKAGEGIEIFCDEQARCVRVREAQPPIAPGLKSCMQEVAQYSLPREWEASPYYLRVSETIREEIDHFWIDLFSAPKPPTL